MSDLAPPPQPPLLLTYSRLVRCFRQASKQGGRDNGEWRTTRSQINSILLFSRAPSHPSKPASQIDYFLDSTAERRRLCRTWSHVRDRSSIRSADFKFEFKVKVDRKVATFLTTGSFLSSLFSLLPSFFSWIRIALKRFIAVARWQARSQTPWYQHH